MNQELIDALKNLATIAASGAPIDMAAIEKLKALAAPSVPRKGPGRPTGSRTWMDTPAVERAREFLRLRVVEGLKPAQAAKLVAKSWDMDERNIYKEFGRHRERLNDEIDRGIPDAIDSLMNHLHAALSDLPERLTQAIVGERDESRIRQVMREVINDWCIDHCETLRNTVENLSDAVVRNEYCISLLKPIADD